MLHRRGGGHNQAASFRLPDGPADLPVQRPDLPDQQRQDGDLDRRQGVMQAEHDAFAAFDDFAAIGVADERQR